MPNSIVHIFDLQFVKVQYASLKARHSISMMPIYH